MQTASAAIIAAVIVVVLVILVAFVWYNYTGWQPFSFRTGDSASWTPKGSSKNPPDISRLRFKGVTFTVVRGDKVTKSADVSAVLNSMAVAYAGAQMTLPLSLTLTRPLNPFSFTIFGFNDRTTVSDPTALPWCTSPPPSCSSDSACPAGPSGATISGACSNGQCFNCPGGATVTLTGKWRTI